MKTSELISKFSARLKDLRKAKDKLWVVIFLVGFFVIFAWNYFFLNEDAFNKWIEAIFYTYSLAGVTVLISFLFGWGLALFKELAESRGNSAAVLFVNLFLDFLKTAPQIIVLLFGYTVMIFYLRNAPALSFVWLAFVLSLAFLNDVFDEMSNRIAVFRKSDFYNAMLISGIKESRIINRDILLLNSSAHLINRAVMVFSSAFFLLCSADFIVSVGLTENITLSGLPATLGNILAHVSSKEDILAVRELFSNPLYFPELFTTHLQGISAAAVLVFTLISAYKISNGIVERKRINR